MRVALTGHRPQRLGLPDDETDDLHEDYPLLGRTQYKILLLLY